MYRLLQPACSIYLVPFSLCPIIPLTGSFQLTVKLPQADVAPSKGLPVASRSNRSMRHLYDCPDTSCCVAVPSKLYW